MGSPLPAFSQIVTSFARVLARSVGSCSTPCLHEATAEATAGSFAEPVLAVELVVEPVLAVELVVEPVLGLAAEVELLELLDELPQPTSSAAVRSAASRLGTRSRVMP
ncbi:MAG TPA: hypothetical protein VK774_00105 [Solirubrobacteraceae bacterium]|nr:hypothetical protein [Solirubrobacteraceae bacterium]